MEQAAKNAPTRDYELGDFAPGMRVQTHPATDYWMMGLRYATVDSVGNTWVRIRFDRSDGKRHTIAARNLIPLPNEGGVR